MSRQADRVAQFDEPCTKSVASSPGFKTRCGAGEVGEVVGSAAGVVHHAIDNPIGSATSAIGDASRKGGGVVAVDGWVASCPAHDIAQQVGDGV